MAFSNYKEVGQVQVEFNITRITKDFVISKPVEPSTTFVGELEFTIQSIDFQASEAARSEAVIFPILREVYKSYHEKFALWIQKPIMFDDNLCGTPDYLLATKSPLGIKVLEKPLLAVVEAKKNDFEVGWGQCLAELVAVQKINANNDQPIYGIVSDGERWEFGSLHENIFTENIFTYTVGNLPELFGALHFVFRAASEAA